MQAAAASLDLDFLRKPLYLLNYMKRESYFQVNLQKDSEIMLFHELRIASINIPTDCAFHREQQSALCNFLLFPIY